MLSEGSSCSLTLRSSGLAFGKPLSSNVGRHQSLLELLEELLSLLLPPESPLLEELQLLPLS